jgi:hypothetical protein
MKADPKEYPWTLWTKQAGESKYTPEDRWATLEDAQRARDSYKAETPTDMFKILPTKEA